MRCINFSRCFISAMAGLVFSAHVAEGQDTNWQPAGTTQNRYGDAVSKGHRNAANSSAASRITPLAATRAAGAHGNGSGNLAPIATAPQRARVTEKSATLPQTAGQVFREYDIRPYTLRSVGATRPEQSIVDWILRETGYEAWHTEPVGLLTASRETLSVYHTPEMQAICADIIDRFVNTRADQFAFSLRLVTIRNPNWRTRALPFMTPIPVQSPGVQGWLVAKEDAALLLAEMEQRTDHREHNSPNQLIVNGQSIVLSTMRPRTYVKGIIPTAHTWPGYQPEMGKLEEGFAMEFSPLLSMDLASADAIVKLRLNQVEKMLPVKLDIPSVVTPNQRVEIEVPQMTTANLHERFRWPTEKVLVLSLGVVAAPDPKNRGNLLTNAVPIFKSPARSDALLIVECKGNLTPATATTSTSRTATVTTPSFHGRY